MARQLLVSSGHLRAAASPVYSLAGSHVYVPEQGRQLG